MVAADAVLLVHTLFVAFVIFGLAGILIGALRGWGWVRNPYFRYAHLAAIAIVVAQAWFGMVCPLTTLEATLREAAGTTAYSGSFIQHWLHRLLFYQAPGWVFTVIYTVFGLAVVLSWYLVRPRARR